jgi:hypothetical protein
MAALLFIPVASLAQPDSSPNVAMPNVTGPIPAVGSPGTDLTRNYPQMASAPNYDLESRGYVEEEFFFDGTATRYQTPSQADGVVLSTGHPYKSRLLVRRPREARNFNGIVLVEWMNVTPGYNFDVHWIASRDYITREGYAWVGVSAQRVGVQGTPNGLTAWSPVRYAGLDVTAGGEITNDSLSYDIFSQAGKAIARSSRESDLLGGLKPNMMLAIGASQSAVFLARYYNSIQPLHKVYDGFMLTVGGGPFRADLKWKLLRINTEVEIVGGQSSVRQPDTNVFRSWEIAGASHIDYWFVMFRNGIQGRDNLGTPNFACDLEPLSHVNNKYVINAGYKQLVDWVRHNKAPSIATPIEVTSVRPTVLPRDENGLVKGGIRLAAVEVPIATNTGANTGPAFCGLYGSHTAFPPSKVAQLYRNNREYAEAVKRVTQQNVRDGFVLPDDAKEINDEAKNSSVGTSTPLPIP